MSGSEDEGESRSVPPGRVLPLNSRRLTSSHLKALAEELELPTSGSLDQLRQLIEGKLETEKHMEVSNVQVVIQESQFVELKLSLVSEEGVLLETTPTKQSVEAELQRSQEMLADVERENSELSEELAATKQSLEDEKRESARLTSELADREPDTGELTRLKGELKAEKEKYRTMWRMTCEQGREQEALIASQKEEIDRLKAGRGVSVSSLSPTPSEVLPERSEASPVPDDSRVRTPKPRQGKAPPINPCTGEAPEVRLDDWLPALKRAADWNGWSEEETLIQLGT